MRFQSPVFFFLSKGTKGVELSLLFFFKFCRGYSFSSISNWSSSKTFNASILSLDGDFTFCLAHSLRASLVCFNFCSPKKFGDLVTGRDQDYETMFIKPSQSTQSGLNLEPMGPRSSSSSNYSKIGL